MVKVLLLFIGGGIGTIARYGLSVWTQRLSESTFPYGTLSVNLLGSLVIGLLWGLTENQRFSPDLRAFVFIGLFGGFTTFSSFTLESFNLFRDGDIKLALINIFVSNILGIALVFGGLLLGKFIVSVLK